MKCHKSFITVLASVLSAISLLFASPYGVRAADKDFASTTIDLGLVVSDVNKTVKFFTETIGFKEVKGFSVSADFCNGAGLTNAEALDIRVLVLGDGKSATKLKVMQAPKTKSKKAPNDYIVTQLGYSYISIFINDTNAALKRLKKAGVVPIAKGPVLIGKGPLYLTVVRDPDGNFVELIGPKK